jgi:hypothetical protein
MGELKDQVLSIIRTKGPALPVQVSREINRDILFASAILAELTSRKIVKITYLKIGGSPLYYIGGQESRLQALSKYLGEKPRKIYTLLQEKKVLRDRALEPWQRVAIREIKDFAISSTVNFEGYTEIFWKWYLTPEEVAKRIIVSMVKPKEEKPLVTPIVKEIPKKIEATEFLQKMHNYFNQNKIKVLSQEILRKNSEIDYIIEVSSDLGNLTFFGKVKNKKKINDGDLSLAYSKAKGRPLLFLTTGELTKKAKDYLERHSGIVFKKI